MKHPGWMLAALALLSGCGSAIGPDQADGSDCNFGAAATACGGASFCDPGDPSPGTGYLRNRTYGLTGDKTHVVGTCKPRGASGAACLGKEQCKSGECVHVGAAPPIGSKGVCQ
ncbi:MAG: hypothetical protein ABJE95_32100 [Byssovorax sp.]